MIYHDSEYTHMYMSSLTRPLFSLASYWPIKAILAAILIIGIEVGRYLAEVYWTLLDTDPILVLLLATLMMLDLMTGVARAIKEGRAVSSIAWRRTGIKAVEYSIIIGTLVMVSNGFGDTPFFGAAIGELGTASLLWACLTETISIMENTLGSRSKALEVFDKIKEVFQSGGDVNIE